MVKSTLIFRNDGLPLSATVDDDQTQNLTEQKNQAKAIVNKVNSNSATEASIRSGNYTIHYLLRESIVFLVIVDKSFSRNLAFAYLQEIANEFINSHGNAALRSDTRPYQFVSFDSFMSKTKKLYQDSRTQSNLDHLNNELSDVKRIMTKNIEDLLYRGESLDDMSDLSYNLRAESKKYRKAARRINLEALIKQYVPVAMVGIFFVFIIWWIFLR